MPERCILIVEDQREVSRLLRSTLETMGAELEVVEIPSGEEALLFSIRNPVDLMIADYRLPGISGVELLRGLRKRQPKARTILVTGQADGAIRKEVAEAGAEAFFYKPIPMDEFLNVVERLLGLTARLAQNRKEQEREQKLQHLPGLLAKLRRDLAAAMVLLLEDGGKILARAGDLAGENIETELIPSLLPIFSAGLKAARLLSGAEGIARFSIEGGSQELLFAAVGGRHALLAVGAGLAGGKQASKKVGIFSAACRNMEELFQASPQPGIATPAEDIPPAASGVEQTLKEMEPLFKEARKKLSQAEAQDFWEKAAGAPQAPSSPDKLSYDQAKQLGLAPGDES